MTYRKVLEVEKVPLITSECWTYYKFAIMQTSNYFETWLTSHMSIYMNQNGNIFFGERGIYPLSYYCEIFDMNEASVHSVQGNAITQFLIDQINNENYIILDLNFKKLFDLDSMEFWRHETLIYGYDIERQVFITPLLINGSFKETKVSFESVEKAYTDIVDYYKQNSEKLFQRRYWFAPITLIKPKIQYQNINAHYDCISKLKAELDGNVITIVNSVRNSLERETAVIYKGLSVMNKLAEIMRQKVICDTKEKEQNYKKDYLSCLKLYEHQNIIYRSLKWFLDTVDNDCVEMQELAEMYRLCCEKMRLNVSLIQKYFYTENNRILLHMADNLESAIPMEKAILEEFIAIAAEIYTRKVLM